MCRTAGNSLASVRSEQFRLTDIIVQSLWSATSARAVTKDVSCEVVVSRQCRQPGGCRTRLLADKLDINSLLGRTPASRLEARVAWFLFALLFASRESALSKCGAIRPMGR